MADVRENEFIESDRFAFIRGLSENGNSTKTRIDKLFAICIESANRGFIPAGTDFNSIYEYGIYDVGNNETYTNAPGSWGLLIVFGTSSYMIQLCVSGTACYIRTLDLINSNWRTWIQL